MTESYRNPNKPLTLEELIQRMQENSSRYDFSDEYLKENGHIMPDIGELTYGASYTPTYWALGYLKELQELKRKEVFSDALKDTPPEK